MMADREKVIKKLEECLSASCRGFRTCPYSDADWDAVRAALALLKEQETLAAHQQDEFMRSWRTIKFSVMDTANNNAGDGNEDIYRILTWVATMMEQQEAKWNA